MERAVYFYKEAASLGHPGASVNLSNCYDSGDGISIDKAKVFELDTFAANLGHPIALNNLGCCYLFGKVILFSFMHEVYCKYKLITDFFVCERAVLSIIRLKLNCGKKLLIWAIQCQESIWVRLCMLQMHLDGANIYICIKCVCFKCVLIISLKLLCDINRFDVFIWRWYKKR